MKLKKIITNDIDIVDVYKPKIEIEQVNLNEEFWSLYHPKKLPFGFQFTKHGFPLKFTNNELNMFKELEIRWNISINEIISQMLFVLYDSGLDTDCLDFNSIRVKFPF